MARIPLFLVPAFAEASMPTACRSSVRSFSSTACNEGSHRTKRKAGRDSNRQRGVSAMRSTGTRQLLGVEKLYPELPRPVDKSQHVGMDEVKTDPNHGLYGFFNESKTTLVPVNDEAAFGRPWALSDLVFKSFEDLHILWWECHLELNRISVRMLDHGKLKLGYGRGEKDHRATIVRRSMNAIRDTLIAREKAYQEASTLYQQKGSETIAQLLNEVEEQRMAEAEQGSGRSYPEDEYALPLPPS